MPPLNPVVSLTARQWQVVSFVVEGLTDAEIGAELGISPRTVSNTLAAVYAKTGESRRARLVHLWHAKAFTLGRGPRGRRALWDIVLDG